MKIFTRGINISIALIIMSVLLGVYVYPILPETMVSHWGPYGEANGTMGKFWGTFLMPLIMAIVFLIMAIVPRFDPKKRNIEDVRGAYDALLILLTVFFFVLYSFILGTNLGLSLNPPQFFPFIFGALFFSLGFILERLKQNWTIGIRTPWTLSSETVWKKTHVLGGKIFKISGILACLGVIFSNVSFLFFLVPLLVGIIVIFIYSYLLYKKEEKTKNPM
ncbi:SdpI family protein [Candidatus Parcubacteria bacterium]|jgi:uncharacterized membrane protein|nr:MAG: SdpI family protein [Candidatus Parcubacteria bacterium]